MMGAMWDWESAVGKLEPTHSVKFEILATVAHELVVEDMKLADASFRRACK